MTDNETARLARQLAEHVKAVDYTSPEIVATAEHILATTTPLTMADVDWDDEKHDLAGATDGDGDAVVMCGENADDEINVIVLWDHHTYSAPKSELTPNGKRYELREVTDKPAHPATLVTEADYENAPEGTVVDIDETVAVRSADWWYLAGFRGDHSSEYMAHLGEGDVIRWGWGK